MLIAVAAIGLMMAIVGFTIRSRPPAAEELRHDATELTPDWNWIGFLLAASGSVMLVVALIVSLIT